MADMVKEIYAGTLTVADIAATGSATLATSDSNTQYVIKDVSVSGVLSTGDKPGLLVNTFRVAELASSATGSEIMDVNSTLKYQAYTSAPLLQSNTLKLISGSSGALEYQDIQNYLINGNISSTNAAAPTKINTGLATTYQNLEFATSTNGSLFYVTWDGNSQTSLYKRTGGVNGSESAILNLSYGWIVFDGIETYYYGVYDNTTLYKYNINTGATATVGMGFILATTSYPSASLMNNGKLLVNPSGNSDTNSLFIVDPVANVYTRITGLTPVSVSGQGYKISGYYDASNGRYTLYKRFGSTLYKSQTNAAVTVGQAYSGGVTNTQFTVTGIGPSSGNYNTAYVSVDKDNYTIALHGVANKTDLTTFNTLTFTTETKSWLPFQTESNTIIQNSFATAAPSAFANSVKVRVTGIKSTF